jgi:hypothetical protein
VEPKLRLGRASPNDATCPSIAQYPCHGFGSARVASAERATPLQAPLCQAISIWSAAVLSTAFTSPNRAGIAGRAAQIHPHRRVRGSSGRWRLRRHLGQGPDARCRPRGWPANLEAPPRARLAFAGMDRRQSEQIAGAQGAALYEGRVLAEAMHLPTGFSGAQNTCSDFLRWYARDSDQRRRNMQARALYSPPTKRS